MNEKLLYRPKPASSDLQKLYTLMGEALCNAQLLEDALSYAIAIKKDIKDPRNVSKSEADKILKTHRKRTLGGAITVIKKENFFDDELRQKLDLLKEDRNWLIHRCMYEALDGSSDKMSFEHCKDMLYIQIKTITNEVHEIQELIYQDLVSYSEEIGLDKLPAYKVGRLTKIRQGDLDKYVENLEPYKADGKENADV